MTDIKCIYPGCNSAADSGFFCSDCQDVMSLIATHEEALLNEELTAAFEIFCAECGNFRPYVEGVPPNHTYDEKCPECGSDDVDFRRLEARSFEKSIEKQLEEIAET